MDRWCESGVGVLLDCVGVGWKHFAREDGSSFGSEDACVLYAS
jgi:hypothetical protein